MNNNTFDLLSGAGVLLVHAGASLKSNPVNDNLFSACTRGSTAMGDNSLTRYTRNCFESSFSYDISVFGTGGPIGTPNGIFPIQGMAASEAGNCFSGGGIPEIENSTNQISYFIFDSDGMLPVTAATPCHALSSSTGVTPFLSVGPDPSSCSGSTVS